MAEAIQHKNAKGPKYGTDKILVVYLEANVPGFSPRAIREHIPPGTAFADVWVVIPQAHASFGCKPSLDTLLQGVYRDRSKLIVVFIGADYQKKDWCGIEFRAIRDIIAAREHQRIMFIRTDNGPVEGVFKTDGYIDATKFPPAKIAEFIAERSRLLEAG